MSKAFLKDQQNIYSAIPQLVMQTSNSNSTVNIRPEYINELSQNLNKHGSSFVDAQIHSNIDSLLQVHRRKMLRRAANRKSAQLSRARKKVCKYLFITTVTIGIANIEICHTRLISKSSK